jgi:hypothetical protein
VRFLPDPAGISRAGEVVAAGSVIVVMGNPFQILDLVNLIADSGESLGDGGEYGGGRGVIGRITSRQSWER